MEPLKVLLINGSPNAKGCTYTALSEVAGILEEEGISTELIHVGNRDIRGCIACRSCKRTGTCVRPNLQPVTGLSSAPLSTTLRPTAL